ncbi:hypothetical protein [Actibacterium lipolyticum]|uniref:Uncharacterized protein n=1 Tax=Actibacterium lipolyticum TaxID=1524263 RepID=A0A238JTD8_9RHOB|nr:hypothetical protein [Actibacterium lipolyticum]SMX33919.1 hypothetical protein COL8621_01125 [Actibacterium lipolyticum]
MTHDNETGVPRTHRQMVLERVVQELKKLTEGWPRGSCDAVALELASRLSENVAFDGAGVRPNDVLSELITIAARLDRIASAEERNGAQPG